LPNDEEIGIEVKDVKESGVGWRIAGVLVVGHSENCPLDPESDLRKVDLEWREP
jgi:hypothetical protein